MLQGDAQRLGDGRRTAKLAGVQRSGIDRDVMHKRHFYELDGQIEPKSGRQVRTYDRPIDFEWQVAEHMRLYVSQLKDRPEWPRDLKAVEKRIRLALALGQAWLNAEPQMDLFA